jgi:hypothetical protein
MWPPLEIIDWMVRAFLCINEIEDFNLIVKQNRFIFSDLNDDESSRLSVGYFMSPKVNKLVSSELVYVAFMNSFFFQFFNSMTLSMSALVDHDKCGT